ncbi:hypothetical protein [Metabacillus indicus]|uniref:hypothetical protein n=1 Tax=Metabacillus indicus TaxID=246786 RepID=UPI0004933479|nr:hypothetical protein [Metabacillus indicus]KEZ48395.1 hypothetical protein AZ46_0215800 [Metabacillus indicus LMG 22858]
MDDQLFEKRLSNLKQSYEKLPVQTSADHIMDRIKLEKQKNNPFFKAKTLYAASFAGVVLIAGLLGAQLLQQNNEGNGGTGEQPPAVQVPPSAEEIEAKRSELDLLFKERLAAFKEEIQMPDAELYPFIQEAEDAVREFKSRNSFQSIQELDNYFKTVKLTVEQNVSSPAAQLAALRAKAEEGEEVRDAEIISLLEKQRMMEEYFFEKWVTVSIHLPYTDVVAYAEQLNQEGSDHPEAGPVIEEIRNSGYRFYHEGEGMINFQPDLELLENELDPSPQMKKYFETENQAQVAMDAALAVPINELAERTVALEDFILQNPNFKYREKLKERYEFWLTVLLKGLNNTMAVDEQLRLKEEWKSAFEQLMKDYPNRETTSAVSAYYEFLKAKNFTFKSQEEYWQYKVNVPQSLKPDVSFFRGREIQLLPVSSSILTAYQAYTGGDSAALNELQPADVLRLYLYTAVTGDADTAYDLIAKDESAPSEEEFKADLEEKAKQYSVLSANTVKLNETYSDDGSTIFELMLKDGSSREMTVKVNASDYTSKVVYN